MLAPTLLPSLPPEGAGSPRGGPSETRMTADELRSIIGKGALREAVAASIAIPGLIAAPRIHDRFAEIAGPRTVWTIGRILVDPRDGNVLNSDW